MPVQYVGYISRVKNIKTEVNPKCFGYTTITMKGQLFLQQEHKMSKFHQHQYLQIDELNLPLIFQLLRLL